MRTLSFFASVDIVAKRIFRQSMVGQAGLVIRTRGSRRASVRHEKMFMFKVDSHVVQKDKSSQEQEPTWFYLSVFVMNYWLVRDMGGPEEEL